MERTGINLVGYLDSLIGIGESARRAADALRVVGAPVARYALPLDVPEARHGARGRRHTPLGDEALPYDVTVLWCSPDRYGVDVDPRPFRRAGHHVIGRWAWELPEIPWAWRRASTLVDEIWVPSTFVADAVRAVVDVPVTVVPNPVAPPAPRALNRRSWGIPSDARLITFVFDHHSTVQRKNPAGVIEAHRRAFAPGDGVTLLVKTINAPSRPAAHRRLLDAAAGRPDIRIVDAPVPAEEREALIAGSDAYVSLHRSEGFGNTIAEAMAAGRPVVATDFGGHRDVFGPENGYPVRWAPAEVGPDAAPYPADGRWADADLDHAAAQLRTVVEDPAEAARRGRAAAADVLRTHGPVAAGHTLAAAVAGAHAHAAR